MSKELMTRENGQMMGLAGIGDLNPDQVALLKRTVASGSLTDDELMLFLTVASRKGLDPFAEQIFAVKRKDGREGREVMTIQVGVAGLRAIADRTGCYAPGSRPEYTTDPKTGKVTSCIASVKKFAQGQWQEVEYEAFYDEYVQMKDGKPTFMWSKYGRTMLAKCAEAGALRRAFPSQLSGLSNTSDFELPEYAVTPEERKQEIEDLYGKGTTGGAKDLPQAPPGVDPETGEVREDPPAGEEHPPQGAQLLLDRLAALMSNAGFTEAEREKVSSGVRANQTPAYLKTLIAWCEEQLKTRELPF